MRRSRRGSLRDSQGDLEADAPRVEEEDARRRAAVPSRHGGRSAAPAGASARTARPSPAAAPPAAMAAPRASRRGPRRDSSAPRGLPRSTRGFRGAALSAFGEEPARPGAAAPPRLRRFSAPAVRRRGRRDRQRVRRGLELARRPAARHRGRRGRAGDIGEVSFAEAPEDLVAQAEVVARPRSSTSGCGRTSTSSRSSRSCARTRRRRRPSRNRRGRRPSAYRSTTSSRTASTIVKRSTGSSSSRSRSASCPRAIR